MRTKMLITLASHMFIHKDNQPPPPLPAITHIFPQTHMLYTCILYNDFILLLHFILSMMETKKLFSRQSI